MDETVTDEPGAAGTVMDETERAPKAMDETDATFGETERETQPGAFCGGIQTVGIYHEHTATQ